jgi:thiol-disulfide isomerase/thioredoxin
MKIIILILTLLLLVGCIEQTNHMDDEMEEEMDEMMGDLQEIVGDPIDEMNSLVDWRDIELKDISSQKTFKIYDFKGTPILLESFAVWCPTCTKQQQEIKKLHEELGDDLISISLDTDPNEDETQILNHLTKNGFTWTYAISPPEITRLLIAEFGQGVVFAPQAPTILICEDQSARLLKSGVKSVDELKQEIEKGC